jgi:16S rRNA (cytidine1402-2'-O)-methyltransferase
LLALMAAEPVALVSDAGTPLISDPGYRLVREARERGLPSPACRGLRAVMGITLSGCRRIVSVCRFLPSKEKARGDVLAELARCPPRWCFTKPRRA